MADADDVPTFGAGEAPVEARQRRSSSVIANTGMDLGHWACTIYYIFIFTIIGVPIWFTTTSPLRSPLPDVSSLSLHTENINHKVHITLVAVDSDLYHNEARKSLRQQLFSQWPHFNSSDGSLCFSLEWKVRPLIPEEERRISSMNSLIQLDKSLSEIQSHAIPGRVWIYLVNSTFLEPGRIKYGSYRFMYINGESLEESALASIVMSMVRSIVAFEGTSEAVTNPASSFVSISSEPPIEPELDVWINIVIEDAHDWLTFLTSSRYEQVQNLTEYILNKSPIRSMVKLRLSSQTVHYAFDEVFIKKITKTVNGQRLVDTKNVPLILNKIESRIPNTGSNAAFQINLVIPSSKLEALTFVDSANEMSNLLLTSARSGFVIWNSKNDMNLGIKFFMRQLVGLNRGHFVNKDIRSEYLLSTSNLFCNWELDSISRRVVQEQIFKSLNALSSVENLLGKVSNMVILDTVSKQMHLAVDMCHKSLGDLSIGRLETALTYSSRAYYLSQRSFFDPSLLSLLYFPDDQKYAVYCPLFLPVGIPIFTSIVHIVNAWIRSRRKKE